MNAQSVLKNPRDALIGIASGMPRSSRHNNVEAAGRLRRRMHVGMTGGFRALVVSALLAACLAAPVAAQEKGGLDRQKLHAEALAEAAEPIRPGAPGKRPFWNTYAKRFIHAPAFDIKPVEGASHYRFTVTLLRKRGGKSTYVFEAAEPWVPLTPIWREEWVWGKCTLKIEGLDEPGGKAVGVAGTRAFGRLWVFDGPYGKPKTAYRESAIRALRFLYRHHPYVRKWKADAAGGELKRTVNVYFDAPVVSAMALLSVHSTDPGEKKPALALARTVADFMLAHRRPASDPLAHFPTRARRIIRYGRYAASAWLDLYDVTKDQKYLDAAKRVADTYATTQLPCGTWGLVVDSRGKPRALKTKQDQPAPKNLLLPGEELLFLDRLVGQYGLKEYAKVRDAAFRWLMENPVKTFDWEGQFWDVAPQPPYRNQSSRAAAATATYLCNHAKEDPKYAPLAEELLRFCEDQFVTYRARTRGRPDPLPTVAEQYRYGAVNYSSVRLMMAYAGAYRATGRRLHLAKALSHANTIVNTQGEKGHYPTHLGKGDRDTSWVNCAAWVARDMLGFAKRLDESK